MSIGGIKIKNEEGEEVHVVREKGSVVNFGRDKKVCHIAFDPTAARVSRVHASLEWNDEGLIFTDKSKEGTMINGQRLRQGSERLGPGIYKMNFGGVPMTLEVESATLEETQPCGSQDERIRVEDNNDISMEDASGILENLEPESSSTSTVAFSETKTSQKRKSDTIFDADEVETKPEPIFRKPAPIFEHAMKNRNKRGGSSEFQEENPAKKCKADNSEETVEMPQNFNNVSHVSAPSDDVKDVHTSPRSADRSRIGRNRTVQYADLFSNQSKVCKTEETTFMDPNIPNFKKFVPKDLRNAGISDVSMYSNTTTTTADKSKIIPMVDSRKYRF